MLVVLSRSLLFVLLVGSSGRSSYGPVSASCCCVCSPTAGCTDALFVASFATIMLSVGTQNTSFINYPPLVVCCGASLILGVLFVCTAIETTISRAWQI